MLLTIKESGCTGFYFPVPQDCTRVRLSLWARLPSVRLSLRAFGPLGQPGPWGVKHSASLLFSCHYISASLIAAVIADIIRYLLLFSYSRVIVGASARAQLQ